MIDRPVLTSLWIRLRAGGPLLLAASLFPACSAGPSRLEEHQATAARRWQELAAQPDRPVAKLGWAEAVRRMEAGNFKLQQARESVRAGEEAVRQVPRNYIPELSLNIFAYPTFRTIGEGRLGDLFFFIGGIVSLPDPARYRAEALQARLQYMAAQVDAELLRRDLQVQLYRAFRKADRLAVEEAQQSALGRLAEVAPDRAVAIQARDLARQIRADWQSLEPEVAELLGDYTKRWHPASGPGLPRLDYGAQPPALDGRDRFAALQLTRAALQLLALDAQRQGLLVAEWPQVSVLLIAPPIYQQAAGRESYLSLGDLRVSGFVTYSTDFRGTRALGREQAARRSALTRHELDAGFQAAMARVRDGLALLTELQGRLAGLRAAEAALRQAGAFAEAATIDRQAAGISDQVDELNFSFWVLDDSRWPRPS